MAGFGERLLSLRQSKQLTQAEVAKYLDVTPKTISFYENGEREASFDTLIKLSEFFNVSVDYLLGCSEAHGLMSDEAQLIDIYRFLSDKRKSLLLSTAINQKRGMILDQEELYTKVVADNGEIKFIKMTREKAKEIKALYDND